MLPVILLGGAAVLAAGAALALNPKQENEPDQKQEVKRKRKVNKNGKEKENTAPELEGAVSETEKEEVIVDNSPENSDNVESENQLEPEGKIK